MSKSHNYVNRAQISYDEFLALAQSWASAAQKGAEFNMAVVGREAHYRKAFDSGLSARQAFETQPAAPPPPPVAEEPVVEAPAATFEEQAAPLIDAVLETCKPAATFATALVEPPEPPFSVPVHVEASV